MESVKKCDYCKKTFTSKRSHAHTCSDACRYDLYKLNKDFELLIAGIPEEEIKCKYMRIIDEGMCHTMYLHWYSYKEDGVKKRFADVYLPKSDKKGRRCDIALMREKIKKMKCKVTVRDNVI